VLNELKRIIERNDDIEEDDIKKAAYILQNSQFLYESRPRQRKHYDVIVRFQHYYADLMDAVNMQLVVNEPQGFVGAMPKEFLRRMRLEETLFLLTLRYVYDEEVTAFHANEDASVYVSLDDLELRYTQLTKREFPKTKSDFEAWTRPLEQNNIIEVGVDENQPEIQRIKILPSIAVLLSGDALKQMEVYLRAEDVPMDGPGDEGVEEESEVEESA
jgi:hypothetical protein